MTTLKMTDQTISQIAKCIQMAILTGTDIVDHLRQLEFTTTDDNTINITDEFLEKFETNIAKMMNDLREKQTTETPPKQLSLFE
jgi:hypothetical protein